MIKIKQVDFGREDLFDLLDGSNNVGVELGVALGEYSFSAVKSKKFSLFIGVDSFELGHYGINEYKKALKKNNIFETKYKIIKMNFDDALDLFDDNSIDFIYFDGFAHNGQLGGKTIIDWYSKVKIGGLVAGDDYDDNWPLVKMVVNDLVKQINVDLFVTKIIKKNQYSEFPSWYFYKKNNQNIYLNESLYNKSIIRDKLEFFFNFFGLLKKFLKKALKIILPKSIINVLKRIK